DQYLVLLALLIICGAFLRFYNLGFNSLWLDEASTLTFARQTLSGIWTSVAGGEFNPPLFYWMEHAMLVFGDSEFVLRFLPALFGVLAIPVMYCIATVFGDRKVGLLAATLMTFSPFAVYYSQDARAYTAVLLFFSLFLLFYGMARRSDDIRYWALAGVFAAIAFWTHFYVLIPIGILYLYAFIDQGRSHAWALQKLRNFAISLGLFLLICLPLIVVMVQLFATRTSAAPTYGIQGPGVITESIIQISGFNWAVAALFMVLFLGGIAALYLKNRQTALLWALLFFAPLLISWVLSSSMPMIPRYLIYLLPIFFVGVAASCWLIHSRYPTEKVVFAFMAIFILVSLPFFTSYYTTLQKNDWRGFSGILEDTTSPGDVVVVSPGYMRQPLDYYYNNATEGTLQESASTAAAYSQLLERYPDRNVYFIVTGDIMAADPSGGAIDWLQTNSQFIGQHTGIYVFTIQKS
ncbi:MAG: glycosyltransferase family 39 protein, partial [Methanomicrobiales archaeon]